MIAVITGDIIGSGNYSSTMWLPNLKEYLQKIGNTPNDWEVYRGDEFQLRLKAEDALFEAISIKALIKSIKGLDVRMGVGIGTETFKGQSVTESNGTAYQRSGRTFETLKDEKRNLAITTGQSYFDKSINLMCDLALDFMDEWTPVSSEIVTMVLQNPNWSQQEMAESLGIQQSAVSQRQKRARINLVLQLLNYYKEQIKEIG